MVTRSANREPRLSSMGRPHPEHAPALPVPLRFIAAGFVFGIIGLLLVSQDARGILDGPPLAPVTLAILHTLTLGFFSMVMMGALTQWLPVLTGTALASERVARMQLGLMVLGLLGFIPGLASGRAVLLAPGGALVLSGIALFVGNLGHTLTTARRPWPVPVWFVASALGFLVVAAGLGGVMALAFAGVSLPGVRPSQALPLHVTVAVGGWLGLTLVGVSWRLFPMFWSVKPDPGPIRATWGLAMSALIAAALGAALGWPRPLAISAGTLGIGTVAFYLQALARYWGRRPRARVPDGPLWLMLGAPVSLVMGLGVASVRVADGAWLVGLLAILLGWFFLSIVAYVQRIVPFMIWLTHHRTDRHAPHLPELWPMRWSAPTSGLASAGYLALWLGTVLESVPLYRIGAALEAGTLMALAAGLVRMVRRARAA